MNIPDPYVYAIVVGLVSSVATLIASRVASSATRTSATTALDGVTSQIQFQTRAKVAEFRQSWIDQLRDEMATMQAIGVTPDLQHQNQQEFYRAGTKIELLMNRNDPRYDDLHNAMYAFLLAETVDEKFACNKPFVDVCQDILKTEWETLKKELTSGSR